MGVLKGKKREINTSFRNNWKKPIHRWYRFHAGCSSDYAESMIDLLNIHKDSVILDPFLGSGTTLVYAKKNGFDSIGFDINDFYVFMSRVKTYWDFDLPTLERQIKKIKSKLQATLFSKTNSFNNSKIENIPLYVFRYFKPFVLEDLSLIKKEISEIENERLKDFMLLGLASILIEVSKVRHVGETIVFKKENSDNTKPFQTFTKQINKMMFDLKIIKNEVVEPGDTRVQRVDARHLDSVIDDESIDHVITHPPYANNYNYLLHDRLPLYFLEYLKTPEDEKRLNHILAGSARKTSLQDEFSPPIKEVEILANEIKYNGDDTRHHALLEYFDTMNKFLETLTYKIKTNGYVAMLVGNSYNRGIMIPLDQLLGKMAEKIGYDVVDIAKVRDRGNGAFQHIYNGQLYESVVILRNT